MATNNQTYNFTESFIRYVIKNTKHNTEAAKFARVDGATWKRYASKFIDSETGKSLYELHKRTSGGSKKGRKFKKSGSLEKLRETIYEGKHPDWHLRYFKVQLLKSSEIENVCANCGFHEERIFDKKMPLVLHFKDDNPNNRLLHNLELLCFNCSFLLIGHVPGFNGWYQERQKTVFGELPNHYDKPKDE